MSAIVIQPTSRVDERTRLLHHSSPPHPGSHASTNDPPPRSYGSKVVITKHIDRSTPLRESISRTRFVVILVGLFSGNFIFAFQATAIPTLAPGISSQFNHAELAAYLGSVFSLASAAVIPIYGVLMDTLGRAFALDAACFFFGAGVVGCALSANIWQLIAARAFAGLGGGGLLTVSSVVVTDLVPLRDRGLYQGIMMTVFGTGSMLGGPISGWISDNTSWTWSFWIQIPVILLCASVVTACLPPAPIAPTHDSLLAGLASLDWTGSFLLFTGVTTLILGFSFHTSFLLPWSHPVVWGCLLVSVVALAVFVVVEERVENPLVPMGLLRSKHRLAILSSGFFLSVGNQAFVSGTNPQDANAADRAAIPDASRSVPSRQRSSYSPLFFSVVVKTSTAQAGMLLSVCGGLGLALGSLIAGQHIRRGGRYRMLGILSIVPSVVVSFLAMSWTAYWPWWGYYLTFLPYTFGYSVFLCVQLVALISAVDSRSMPKATALLYTVRTVGVTLGVSIGGSIQIGSLASNLRKAFSERSDREQLVSAILHSKSAIAALPLDLASRAVAAYSDSIKMVWAISGVVMVVTMICAMGIQEKDTDSGKGSPSRSDANDT